MDAKAIEALRSGARLPNEKLETLRTYTRCLSTNRGKASKAEMVEFFEAGYTEVQVLEVIRRFSHRANGLFYFNSEQYSSAHFFLEDGLNVDYLLLENSRRHDEDMFSSPSLFM